MKRLSFHFFSGLAILLTFIAPSTFAQSIKSGTQIKIHLVDKLDTGEVKQGQAFKGTLAEPVSLGGRKVLARGTQVNGRVTEAVSSGRLKQSASVTLILTSVSKTAIRTEALQIDGKSHAVRNTALIGGGAAAGAILGGIAGGGKGAVVGTAVGAGAGTGTAFMTGKKEIVLPPESELTFVVAGAPAAAVTRTPEPIAVRNTERAPESSPAIWRDNSRQSGSREGGLREERDDAFDALIFSERDKWLIHSYFNSNYGNLPPGLAKRDGNLPPGLEKHMRRDESLPPGLQKRVELLPSDLERRLPRLPFGYSRVVLSGRVMILADDGQIVDLMFIYR